MLFIVFVSGLAALIVAIGLVYLRTMARGKIRNREELEKSSSIKIFAFERTQHPKVPNKEKSHN